MIGRSAVRQFLFVFVTTAAVVVLLRQTEVAEQVAYSIEKGRLRALAERLPSEELIESLHRPNRVVAELVTPAVVYIETKRSVNPSDMTTLRERLRSDLFNETHPWLRRRGGDGDDEGAKEDTTFVESGLGSGFVVDADRGFVLTNYHVTEGADSIEIVLHDGRRYEADMVGVDPETDLAVLSIPPKRLHQVSFGDSSKLAVGDDVFALGSPFGLDGTFSQGIVSGLGRCNIAVSNVTYQDFIQTDAVINPGNSGGPLVNRRGEVVGVNTAIATTTGNFNGVGFAIPSGRVVQLLPQLLSGGKIVRGFLGVGYRDVHDYRREAEEALGWTEGYGVIVDSVLPDTPADMAGIDVGDVLIEVGGAPVRNSIEFRDVIAQVQPGTRVAIRLWRGDGFRTVEAKLIARP